jgi:hypothetical protein
MAVSCSYSIVFLINIIYRRFIATGSQYYALFAIFDGRFIDQLFNLLFRSHL